MVLVTGGTGFLGSELINQLLLKGFSVRALKRENSVIPELIKGKEIEWFTADVVDYFSLESAWEGIESVYHCAAYISFDSKDKKKLMQVNTQGTSHVVNLCLEKNVRLLHVSSVAAIGDGKPGVLITEKDQWEFNGTQSAYSISKYTSEMEVFRGMAEGLNALIVNPSVIIGKNAGYSGSGALFKAVKNGLKYYPTGSCGLVDVEDVVNSMIQLMQSENINQRYIINAENWPYQDLFTTISKYLSLVPPTLILKMWMLQFLILKSKVQKYISSKKPTLTNDIAKSAFKRKSYSNAKISMTINIKFKPVEQSISEICAALSF